MSGWRTKAKAAVVVAAIAALEVVSYRMLRRYGSGLNSIPTVVMEEFPEIDRELLEKFTSFDPELGWSPQPNTTKQKDTGEHLPGEEVRTVVTYSTDEYGSRVCPARDRREDDVRVSTYGDSYCFCREVDDDETFQNYLAEKIDAHVGNYGGGNYGLDQGLLRLKRTYPEDPADYVFMVVTASSIARVLSVWKHYQEFGNVLAVKPRYVLEDGDLRLVESPIRKKEDLLHLERYAEFLRSRDYHYEHWFRPHLVTFPYAPDLFGDPRHLRYVLYAALRDAEREYGVSVPGIDPGEALTRTTVELEQPRVKYHESLFDEKEDLFSAIVGEFVSYAEEKEFTPVFVMSQQLRYAAYEEEHGPVYGDLLDRLDERYPALETVDLARHLSADGDVESLYVERGEGGHYSPETNERIAEVLFDEVLARPETGPERDR
ncbi:hypothetical protein [Halopelagius longus]|uniref:SGNH/GDSL hydrolase family protein n=1 Tax=Halopelagius longus TaxID=1236180 RepID=A0A1H1BUW2_9EURY|nr:hypothetical protein [Halopelagius longus]RDI70935.1 hypothetical protein DWB78_03880 [Halopelagius longus]SDQ55699.1 hypothetical protein SAMN05216278_1965 [Halopelagius longus]